MQNIDKLDGYEFEDLICILFRKMGFIVEHTALSGDGGIDIIAHYNETVFKGKYLIQCKRYSSKIGEPFIRDLYGVTLSSNANKGILITNSFFSNQAIKFAEGKNIELIDGNELNKLLLKYGLLNNSDNCVMHKSSHYSENLNFDKEKYNYFHKRLAENKNDLDSHEKMFHFLYNYLISEGTFNKDLITDCLNLSNEILYKFIKKSNQYKIKRDAYIQFNIALLFMENNIECAVDLMKKSHLDVLHQNIYGCNFSPSCYISEDFFQGDSQRYIQTDTTRQSSVILRNLLVIFCNCDFKLGIDYILDKFQKNYELDKNSPSYYQSIFQKNQELFFNQSIEIIEKRDINIYLPHNADGIESCYSLDCFYDFRDTELMKQDSNDFSKQLQNIMYLLELK